MGFGLKTRRGRRYWWLREHHFAPTEARAFSQLTRKYPALQRLVASRLALWANFTREARRKGWESESKRRFEWRKKIVSFYERKQAEGTKTNWVVEKDVRGQPLRIPRINPWAWYDYVFQRLPDELKWDTPRSHRTKQPDVKVDKIQTRRWIEDLKKSIERTTDERERERFRQQIKTLERSLRKA